MPIQQQKVRKINILIFPFSDLIKRLIFEIWERKKDGQICSRLEEQVSFGPHLKIPTPPSSNLYLCQISNISESLKIIVSFLIEYFLGHRHITSRSRRECWCLIQVNDIIHGNTAETRFYINVCYLQTMVWLTDNVLMM